MAVWIFPTNFFRVCYHSQKVEIDETFLPKISIYSNDKSVLISFEKLLKSKSNGHSICKRMKARKIDIEADRQFYFIKIIKRNLK